MKHFPLILILASCLSGYAVTLEECRQMAKENFPVTKSYAILDKTEKYTLETASKAWLPQVQVGAQASWQNHVPAYPDAFSKIIESQGMTVEGMRKDQYRISADVRQIIWDGGRISAEKDIARARVDESRRSNDVQIYALYERVDEVFFAIILLTEQEKAVDASIELLEANVKTLNACYKNGAAMESDVDAVKVQLLEAQRQKANIAATADSFKKVLALYIGMETCPSLDMPAEAEENIFGKRPEYALFEAQQASLLAEEKAVQKSLMPSLSFFGSTFYGYPGMNSMDAMLNHKWKWNLMVGASITWNISAFYSKSSKINNLRAKSEYVNNQRELFDYNQRLLTSSQSDEIKRLEIIAQNDDEIVNLRSKVRKAEEAKLREGIINPTDLLLKITEERNARILQATHKIDILKAKYKLNHTLGHEEL